jgi:glycosyltransferase involved in cell wall biosynthesis
MTDQFTSAESHPVIWYVAAGYAVPAGIEAHVLHYATEMRNHGFDTRVVVFKPLPPVPHRFLAAMRDRGIPIDSLDDRSAPGARIAAARWRLVWRWYNRIVKRRSLNEKQFEIWMQNRCSVAELKRLLARERPDIVHIFGRLRADAWGAFPPEHTIYHEMMTGTVDQHWLDYELNEFRTFAERAARFFAPGEGVAKNVRHEYGISRKIQPIYTMCPDETTGETANRGSQAGDCGPAEMRFGAIFRLTGQKGISYLLEALKLYRERHGNVDFTFGGFGPMEGRIREFATANGLSNVRIVSVTRPSTILNELDVFVHPSVDDAMPMSIAEALMCGVPCIVSHVGGCADLVRDGKEGFVVEPRHPEQVREGMERFARMSFAERAAFRERARTRYEEVCLPASVGRVVADHYRAILRERGSAPDPVA